MRKIEDTANRLTDMDWGWWPFLFLRPEKHIVMTTKRVFKISLFYGPITGLLVVFLLAILGYLSKLRDPRDTVLILVAVMVISIVFFFIGYRFTFAYFWNRRATRLQKSE